jgi:hypothetical protein
LSDYDVVYPPSGRINFDGGQNSAYDKFLIADNETPEGRNIIYSKNAAETRGGTSKLNTGSVGTQACDGLFTRHDRTGTETMVAFFGGTGYYLANTSFITIGSAQSIWTAGVDVGGVEQENYLFVSQGNQPYKYNGAFTRHGIPAPNSAPTIACNATGGLTGSYSYKVTYVNSALVEGDIGTVSNTFTAAAGQIGLTGIPVAPTSFGVNSRKLYRTEAGGSSYKLVTTISDNTTTTYSDNKADLALGAVAPTDNGEPPPWSFAVFHKGRLFVNDVGNKNLVWYSELENPYVFGALNFLTVGDNTSDLVEGLKVFDDCLYVLCRRGPYFFYMPSADPDEWQGPIKVRSEFGTRSPHAIVNFNDKMAFPALENDLITGFAAIAGVNQVPDATTLTTMAVQSKFFSERISPDVQDINESFTSKIVGIVFKNKIYFSVASGASPSNNNMILIYDFSKFRLNKKQEGSWIPWTGLQAGKFTIYNDKLYYGSANQVGYVYEMNTQTYNDDGAAIDSYLWTKEFQGEKGDEDWSKDFRTADVLLERSGDYTVEMRYRTDSDSGVGNQTLIDVSPGGSTWGSMRWGTDNWSAGASDLAFQQFLGQARGKTIQFKFSNLNTVNQKFKVIGLKYGYNKKGKR